MPDQSGISPPYLDPSQYPAYLDMQRKQMLASMLMQNAQQSNQTPANWDSMKVVPRRSALSSVSSMLGSYLAGNAMKGSQQAQQKYFQGLYGGGDSAPQPGSAAAPTPAGAPPDASGGTSMTGAGTPAQSSQSPLIPSGMSRGQAQQLMGLMGPEKYGESVLAPNLKPAEIRAQIRAAGIDPDSQQGRAMALASLNKGTMTDVRPGGTLMQGTKPIFTAPQNGIQTQWGPGGPSQAPVPGAPQASAAMTAADTAAKVANTPQTFPTAGGGSTVGYPGDVLGAPPALRDATPPAPPVAARNAPPASAPAGGYFPSLPKPPAGPLWQSMPKLPVSNALGAPNDFVKGRLQQAGQKDGELSTQYGKEADLADQKLQYNTEAAKALAGSETGPSSEWMTEHRASLLEWGVPAGLIPGAGKVTDTQELNKNLKQSALQGARAIFGNRMTQMEVKLQHEELSPSTSMTKDAISSLMQQDNIKQQYAKQRSQDYGTFVQNGGDPLRFESWYSSKRPLTRFAAQATTPQPAIQRLQQNPGLLPDFKAKYGWDPNE